MKKVRLETAQPANDGELDKGETSMSTGNPKKDPVEESTDNKIVSGTPPLVTPDPFNAKAHLDADLANDRATLPLFAAFNAEFARMEAERSLTKRRQLAISFAPKMIKQCVEGYRAHCHAEGCFIDPDTRALDCMWWRLLEAFEEPCKWTPEEVRKAFRVYEDDEA